MSQRITRSMRKTRSFFHPTAATTTHAVGRKVPRKAGAIRIKQEQKPTPSTPVKSTKVADAAGLTTLPPKSKPSMAPTTSPSTVCFQAFVQPSTAPVFRSHTASLAAALLQDFGLEHVSMDVFQSLQDKAFYEVIVLKSQKDHQLYIFCRGWCRVWGTYELEGPYAPEQVKEALGFGEYSRCRSELAQTGEMVGPRERRCGIYAMRGDTAVLYSGRTLTL